MARGSRGPAAHLREIAAYCGWPRATGTGTALIGVPVKITRQHRYGVQLPECDDFDWQDDQPPGLPPCDLVICAPHGRSRLDRSRGLRFRELNLPGGLRLSPRHRPGWFC